MPELQMDVAVANRFISSLSKSLQALCHGCMDFDSGIEIVGYINVNIDCGSKVDYVLNEKVLKSTTNSMTFVSNSFLAKKEQQKQTRDGACSPIPDQQPPVLPQYQNRFRGSFHGPHPRNIGQTSFAQRGSQKRSWPGMERDWRMSPKKQRDGRLPHNESATTLSPGAYPHLVPSSSSQSPADASFKYPQTSGHGSETNTADDKQEINIKTEVFDSDTEKANQNDRDPSQAPDEEASEYSDETSKTNNISIKNDPDALSTTAEDESHAAEGASDHPSTDFEGTFLNPAVPEDDNPDNSEENKQEADENNDDQLGMSRLARKRNQDVDADSEDQPAETGDTTAEISATGSEMPTDYDEAGEEGAYAQSVYSDAGEGSSDAGQFEVIEIDDEDEDVQAMFGGSRPKRQRYSQQGRNATNTDSVETWPSHSGYQSSGFSGPYEGTQSGLAYSSLMAECVHCHQVLIKTQMRQHIVQEHSNAMPFQCALCGKGFLSVSGLNHHKMAHEGRKFVCPICDSKFNQKSHLKSHLNKVHKLAQCPTCSLTFSLGDEFNQHVLQCG